MEKSSTSKCKKRKTRKYLNEIRKRSLRNINVSDSLKKAALVSKLTETVTNSITVKPNLNCMTSNRLTLTMFPKAIRSETITRPALSEIRKENSVNFNKMECGRPTCTATSISVKEKQANSDSDIRNLDEESINSVSSTCNEVGLIPLQKGSASANVSNHGDRSPSSFILFSPIEPTVDTEVLEASSNQDTVSTPISPSSPSSREGFDYHLYEEFMNEIPEYLKELAPALIKEDVIKKMKASLHNICMEGCRRDCEHDLLHSRKRSTLANNKTFTPQATIMQNPMDYLRLGCTWQQDITHSLKRSLPSSSAATPHSPLELHSPRSAGSRQTDSMIHDTPEYTYFPHKLNQ